MRWIRGVEGGILSWDSWDARHLRRLGDISGGINILGNLAVVNRTCEVLATGAKVFYAIFLL